MATTPLQPGVGPANPHASALETLSQWRDVRGLRPFASAASCHVADRCSDILSEANCILAMLSAAFQDAGDLTREGKNSEFCNRTKTIMAGALDGVGRLIDLAAFTLED